MRFKLMSGVDLCNAPPMACLVHGVFPLKGLAAIFSLSGECKTFLMIDLAAAIASGANYWFGRRLRQCHVTYVCLEGEQGIGKRLKAWSQHHDKPVPESLRFIVEPFNLISDHDVSELAKAVQDACGGGGLVIIDTLNRAAPGADENSSTDMGKIIAGAKRLQTLTGGLVLLVHHTGKNISKGMRGHSSLHAALDGAIEVVNFDGCRKWRVAKSKDDETGCDHPFTLHPLTVGVDEFGDEITSCVVLQGSAGEVIKRTPMPRGENQKIALQVVDDLIRNSIEYGKGGALAGCSCVQLDDAIGAVAVRLSTDAKHSRERAQEALTALVRKGICGTGEGWVWRT
jgi:hypothetical protein